mmetsp:Transcript_16090/g.35649  ORF Transcript_16090/g.35649 Transcript_16090/m.35649 type:complete len:333 (-) Transcript_16090:2389-3387(-)
MGCVSHSCPPPPMHPYGACALSLSEKWAGMRTVGWDEGCGGWDEGCRGVSCGLWGGGLLAEGAVPLLSLLPALRGVRALPPEVVGARVVVVVNAVPAHGLVHAGMGALAVHTGGGGVALVHVEGGELPAQDIVRLPVLIPRSSREAHIAAPVVQGQRGGKVYGCGDDGGVHVIQIYLKQTEPHTPVALAAVGEVGVIQEPRREAADLEGGVRHLAHVEIGVVFDAQGVHPVGHVGDAVGGGQGAGVVGGYVEAETLRQYAYMVLIIVHLIEVVKRVHLHREAVEDPLVAQPAARVAQRVRRYVLYHEGEPVRAPGATVRVNVVQVCALLAGV